MFTYSLIVTDGVNLRPEHHSSENEEEQTLKAQEDEEDDGCRRREGTALWGEETGSFLNSTNQRAQLQHKQPII